MQFSAEREGDIKHIERSSVYALGNNFAPIKMWREEERSLSRRLQFRPTVFGTVRWAQGSLRYGLIIVKRIRITRAGPIPRTHERLQLCD